MGQIHSSLSKNLKLISSLLLMLSIVTSASVAHAIAAEVGVSYGRKKTSFDAANYDEQESTTGSLSLYFLERVALELSYTDAMGVRNEVVAGNQQTTTQKTNVYGADLILILLPRTSFIQPYIKGGVARLDRQKNVKVNNLQTEQLAPETSDVPSYGAGFKIAITESFGAKLSYDVWRTPIGNGNYTDDTNIKAGLTWTILP